MTRTLTTIAAALLATSAFAASHGGPFDADGDKMLTEAEFETAATMLGTTFDNVDTDDDGSITEVEYNQAAFDAADEDNSNTLDVRESETFRELTRAFDM